MAIEITCREFLERIMGLDGDGALIDDSRNGRYELRIYSGAGAGEYVSPNLYQMLVRESIDFEASVESEAVTKMPRLSRYRL